MPRRVSVVERGDRGPSRVTIEFEDWNLAPGLPDRAFAFVPPPGAIPAALVLRPETPAGRVSP
jgi:outer membrane lipoprotein-sorting protein